MVRSPGILALSETLLKARFAVLLSGDGGPTTWGSPDALAQVAQTQLEATGRFKWNSRTYAVGLSMGGLMALRSALPGSPYPVHGLALIDAWTDLRGAWGTAVSRRTEISTAYRLTGPPQLNWTRCSRRTLHRCCLCSWPPVPMMRQCPCGPTASGYMHWHSQGSVNS
ncbi:hypothetical protein ACFSC4_03400 [Deinococcus malanensis]|uniref:hypothetical protein n=1 Tax=Deinococcus malanensis TaxID=1706855 RepID=UPI00362F4A34